MRIDVENGNTNCVLHTLKERATSFRQLIMIVIASNPVLPTLPSRCCLQGMIGIATGQVAQEADRIIRPCAAIPVLDQRLIMLCQCVAGATAACGQ
jgi:hypothetical protein